MKYRELTRQLRRYGWYLKRQGADHEIWSNGEIDQPVPRHNEINELLARFLLKYAAHLPGKR